MQSLLSYAIWKDGLSINQILTTLAMALGVSQDRPHFHPAVNGFMPRRGHSRDLLQPNGTSSHVLIAVNHFVLIVASIAPIPFGGTV
jgi:hypothetical protein